MEKTQKEYYLNEQMKAIQKELSDGDGADEIAEYEEKINKTNIRRIRPGFGLEPKYYEKLIGKKAPFKLIKGEPLKKSLLKKLNIK